MQIITGPNMGGKSTYMRQVALIVLLASMGSHVPAASCRLGPIDAIHTRIGAADDLANAQSTFMLEMVEAAQILHAATPHSLVLMDEIGRGTSTFDGLALASGIATHLHDKTRAFTLFATHYFELTELPAKARHAVNMHVSAAESGPTSSSCTKSSPARPAAATASRWPNWPACPRPCCTTPATPWPRWKNARARANCRWTCSPPARSPRRQAPARWKPPWPPSTPTSSARARRWMRCTSSRTHHSALQVLALEDLLAHALDSETTP
jgi:hypothetical protein